MAVAITTHDSELDALRHRLTARLETLREQVRWRLWLDVASRIVVAFAALVIVSFVIDWWLDISRTARITYTVLSVGLVVWLTTKLALAIVRLRLEPIELAGELDKAGRLPPSQWIAPRVATVLQLSDARIREAGYSAPMVDRAVRHSSQTLDGIDFSRRLDERHLRQCAVLLAAAVLAPMLFAVVLPGELSSIWARRWLLGSNAIWPRDTAIEVLGLSDGRLIVPRGEPASVRVAVRDRGRADRGRLDPPGYTGRTAGDSDTGEIRQRRLPLRVAAAAADGHGRLLGRRWPGRTGRNRAGRPSPHRPVATSSTNIRATSRRRRFHLLAKREMCGY